MFNVLQEVGIGSTVKGPALVIKTTRFFKMYPSLKFNANFTVQCRNTICVVEVNSAVIAIRVESIYMRAERRQDPAGGHSNL